MAFRGSGGEPPESSNNRQFSEKRDPAHFRPLHSRQTAKPAVPSQKSQLSTITHPALRVHRALRARVGNIVFKLIYICARKMDGGLCTKPPFSILSARESSTYFRPIHGRTTDGDSCTGATTLLQLSAAQEHAQAVDQTDALTLTPRDWEAFVAVLDHQDRPPPWLAGAMIIGHTPHTSARPSPHRCRCSASSPPGNCG